MSVFMSESSLCQSDGSVVTKNKSQNVSIKPLGNDKNLTGSETETVFNIQSIDLFKEQSDVKDNFNINFFNLKSEKRNSLKSETNFKTIETDERSPNNVINNVKGSQDVEKISDEYGNNTNELSTSEIGQELNAIEKIEEINNHHSLKETDGKVMKAAFSRVAEQFGLTTSKRNSDIDQTFYGVYIPNESSIKPTDEVTLHVYTEKAQALKVMKQSKKARLKQFKSKKEAVNFVIHCFENPVQNNVVQCVSTNEKVMPFKCPKIQDMISFKKTIENGDVEEVRKKILDNPRYLVSSGDTPSILQEGSRYNALHIAAKSKNVEIVRLILESITNVEFISYLYDDNDVNSCKQRIDVLLDLYLNMPDKGLNETPLHIAVKHGAVDIIEYLISYPQCQRNLMNKFHQQPKDLICSRVNNPSEALKHVISGLLEEQYFIPVLRYEDNSMQPRVGEAFSPSKPLNLREDLLSPRIEVQAYAGPMSKESAELFKKKWKSPRSAKMSSQSSSLRLQDMEKGLEKIGRNLAQELKVPWREYWPFLDTFVDLASEEGLLIFEHYLKNRFNETLEMVGNRVNSGASDNDKLVSPISALTEAMGLCSLNEDSSSPAKRLKWNSWSLEKRDSHRRTEESVENDVKNPLLYVERSCEVFGKRVASAIASSSDMYGIHTDCIKDSLEIQTKHLMSNILSYREDNRFQSVNFQMIHSRVATVAVHSLEDFTDRDMSKILNSLKDIDWSDGTLSDDEDLNYNCRNLNQEVIGNSVKQHLHCLVKNLINELNDYYQKVDVVRATVRNEADCSHLWALATPCCCSWSLNLYLRPRIGVKRKSTKYPRSNIDCDIRIAFRRVLTEDIAESESDKSSYKTDEEEEDEDVFVTPPSGLSDTEDEVMEDPMDLPDTFIYEGSMPSKTDYAVLETIESVDLSSEKYPNICRWKHLVSLCSKTSPLSVGSSGKNLLNSAQKKRITAFTSPNSSPGKGFNKSIGPFDSPHQGGNVEPWERILGPYSPCTPKRAPLSIAFNNLDLPIKR